jgi:hypothetical protein
MLIEPFHNALDLRRLRDCIRKQLTWHHSLDLGASGVRLTQRCGSSAPEGSQ